MVSAAMRLKDACSLEGKLWQRHCFANIGPYSQRYGFSSSHVWILELDHKKRLNTEELILSNCGAGEDSRVPWTARRSKQSNLKKISPEHPLEGLMLKLKLQYFGHLMQRADSLEKILMLERLKAKREGSSREWDC